MENQFGVKDFVLYLLIAVVITLVIILMFQLDQQRELVSDAAHEISINTRDLSDLRRQVQQGLLKAPAGLNMSQPPDDSSQPSGMAVPPAPLTPSPAIPLADAQAAQSEVDNAFQPASNVMAAPDITPATADSQPALPTTSVTPPTTDATMPATAASRPIAPTAIGKKWGKWSKVSDPFARVEAHHAAPDFAAGDSFVDTFSVVPEKLTPLIGSDAYSSIVQGYVQESLANRDPDTFEWTPSLAKCWRTSQDGLSFEFELWDNLNFSDGTPLTADDVIYTFDLILNPDIQDPRYKSGLDKLGRYERDPKDKNAVIFTFTEPYFQSFDAVASQGIMSKAFYSKYTADEYNKSVGLLLGSGPYRLPDPVNWKPEPGKPLELVRNDRYWGGTKGEPAFDKMTWQLIDSDNTRMTTFTNGDTDTFGPTPEQYEKLIADPDVVKRTQHAAMDVPNSGYRYVGWNEVKSDGTPSVFADKKVRQALTMLTDRDSICRDIMLGLASVNTGPFSPLTGQADPNIQPWPFDVERAQKQLTSLGFTMKNGQMYEPDGSPFKFKLMFNGSSDVAKRIVSFISDTYAKAGIQVIAEPTEWTILLQHLDNRDFEACMLGWTGGIEDDPYQIFDSSQIAGTADDFVHYADPDADKLIEAARTTIDKDQRMLLWHKLHAVLHEDQPYTFLYIGKDLEFIDGRFKGVDVTKVGYNSNTEWSVPREQQKRQ